MKKYPNLVYKIVWRNGDKLFSCCQNVAFPERLRVEYIPGKITRPVLRTSRLFAFTSYLDARSFLKNSFDCSEEHEIWSATAYGNLFLTRALAFGSLAALNDGAGTIWLGGVTWRQVMERGQHNLSRCCNIDHAYFWFSYANKLYPTFAALKLHEKVNW